ncbi:MAG: hypothetical protein ACOX4U_07470 [Anaerovoracaceae bacterium]|jgi:ABC-2 type transport system permease protein
MKSKASYFNISGTLIRENLRRFWALSALTFLTYFFSSVFPILIYLGKLDQLARYIDMCLHNLQPFFMMAHLLTPIFAAIIVFRYLQSTPGSTVMHALPFNKAMLFNSGLISGFILIASPILLNGLLFLAIRRPVLVNWWGGQDALPVDIFTYKAILIWIASSLLIVTFIYVIAIFGGMVTGTSVLHLIGAGGFNFLVPALYGSFVLYFIMYLYGFNPSGDWWRTMALLSPYSEVIASSGVFTTTRVMGYLIAILSITLINAVLYQKRRLEKAGDAMSFRFMEPVICYLITFFGMTAMGFYFNALGEGPGDRANFFTYLGFALGTIIFFFIGRMTVKKTARVFNIESLKSLAIYVVIAGLFLTGLNVDAAGFERRIPNVSKVDKVTLDGSAITPSLSYRFNEVTFKDKDNIKHVAALHKTLIENKKHFLDNETIHKLYLTLDYKKGKQKISRSYHVDYIFFIENPHFKALCESKEYKDYLAPSKLKSEAFTQATLFPFSGKNEISLEGDEINSLLQAYEKDFRAMPFEDMMGAKKTYLTLNLGYIVKEADQERLWERYENAEYPITSNCVNSINWLKNNGYWDDVAVSPDHITKVELYRYQYTDSPDSPPPYYMEGSDDKPVAVVYDKGKIKKLLDNADAFPIDETSYYYGYFFMEDGSKVYRDEYKEDYMMDSSHYGPSETLFFNDGIDFIK